MNWQPIETAPKDETVILAYDPTWYSIPHPMLFRDGVWCFWVRPDLYSGFRPTHWMPLPEPPEEEAA